MDVKDWGDLKWALVGGKLDFRSAGGGVEKLVLVGWADMRLATDKCGWD